ncbi:MAG: MopE-related protein [bacterium]
MDADRDPANGCEYACVPDGAEACDGRDNDCDGATDEGFDLPRDPQNCGRCGVICEAPGATVACVAGRCGISGCQPGFANPDGDPGNGCECRLAGAEQCNGLDEDCDGRIDEGVDVQNDPANCGGCGRACAVPNAEPVCLQAVCGVGRCRAGFGDADGQAANGCECAVANGGAELCNAADEDCDGRVDEGFDLGSDVRNCGACGRRCVLANASPLCGAGRCRVDTCLPGFGNADANDANGCECRIENGGAERCNAGDDDCDGRVDEGFDLQGDSANCGGCGRVCDPAHAVGRCAAGRCEIVECAVGFVDGDGQAANGCEVDCAVAPAGTPGCGGGIVYQGLYDLQAPVQYSCRDVIFGEVVVSVSFSVLAFRVDGGVLNVQGANTLMSQAPAPVDGGFAVSGAIDGGCREVYQLQGQFDDQNVWRGLFQIRFEGLQCGFTECANQAIAVVARRR